MEFDICRGVKRYANAINRGGNLLSGWSTVVRSSRTKESEVGLLLAERLFLVGVHKICPKTRLSDQDRLALSAIIGFGSDEGDTANSTTSRRISWGICEPGSDTMLWST